MPLHMPTYIRAYSRYKCIRVWTQIQIEKRKAVRRQEKKNDRETSEEGGKRKSVRSDTRCHFNLYS